LWRQEEKLFFKNQNQNQKQKQKQKPRQIVATQKRKKMKKGVVAAALVQGAQQNFRSQQRTKNKNKNCDKITEKQAREKSTRKLYTTGKSAKSEGRNPHKIQRRKEGPPK
jgi:hypothetical protein